MQHAIEQPKGITGGEVLRQFGRVVRNGFEFFFGSGKNSPPPVDPPVEPVAATRTKFHSESRPVLQLHEPGPPTVIVRYPRTFADAKTYADQFVDAGEMVLIEVSKVKDERVRQQIVDFLAGVAYGLKGTAERLNSQVFLFAPRTFKVHMPPEAASQLGQPRLKSLDEGSDQAAEQGG